MNKCHLKTIRVSPSEEKHSCDAFVFLTLLDSSKWIWRRLQSDSEHSARNVGDGGDDNDGDDDVCLQV